MKTKTKRTKTNQFTRSIQLSSSVHFSNLADYRAAGNGKAVLQGQTAIGLDNGYGLQGNATVHALQDSITQLERGKHTLLYPSGATALYALAAFLQSGDHWLLPDGVYFPVRRYAEYLKQYGVTYSLYDQTDLLSVKKALRKNTKLIHIESPISVTFEVADVAGIVALAKSQKILTSADNTWAGGVLYHPLDQGVDISVLSLTKYPAGYSDVFMGSVTTKDRALYKRLSYHHRVYGYTVSPFSAMLVARGLESLRVRLAEEGRTALQLIEKIKQYKNVSNMYYLDSKKEKDFSGPNSLFSVALDRLYTDTELEKAFSVLSTFTIGESWGGTRSLVLPFQPHEFTTRFAPPKHTIIRFHVGLEDSVVQLLDIQAFFKALEKI